MNVSVDSMMEVVGPEANKRAISFVIEGEAEVQQRHRIAWKGMLGAWERSKRRTPVIYDSSSKQKKALHKAVKEEMEEIGISSIPYFNLGEPLALELTFLFQSKASKNPQPFPKKKDLDNMVKYFMDAMNGLLYHDDTVIVCLVAKKVFGENSSTVVSISNRVE
jgi:Holliday junction resolvase RusA-like endonuclease